jgi:Cas6b N-terminal domain
MQFTIQTLSIETNLQVDFSTIKAVRNKIGSVKNIADYFHNHDNEDGGRLKYDYPQVHYTIEKGCVKLTAYNEAVPFLRDVFDSKVLDTLFPGVATQLYPKQGEQQHYLRIDPLHVGGGFVEEPYRYLVHNYLPLNNIDYDRYKSLANFYARVAFIENKLQQHLRYLIKGMIPPQQLDEYKSKKNEIALVVEILDIDSFEKVPMLHDVNVDTLEMRLRFKTNMLLPSKAAIGNDIAFGKGQIEKLR